MDSKCKKVMVDLEKALIGCLKAEDTRGLDEIIIAVFNTIEAAAKQAKKASLILPGTLKAKIF